MTRKELGDKLVTDVEKVGQGIHDVMYKIIKHPEDKEVAVFTISVEYEEEIFNLLKRVFPNLNRIYIQ